MFLAKPRNADHRDYGAANERENQRQNIKMNSEKTKKMQKRQK
jgi:hypothetical protein